MEGGIAVRAQAAIPNFLFHSRQRALHGGEIAAGAPRGSQLGQLDLQRLASLQHIGQAPAALDEPGQRLPEPACPPQEHTLTVADVYEAERLEHDERLADGGPAHLQAVSEVALRWKLVSRRHPRLAHEFPESLAHVLVQPSASLERPQRCSRRRAHRRRVYLTEVYWSNQ